VGGRSWTHRETCYRFLREGGHTDLGVSFHITRVGTSLTLGVEIIELLRTEELDTSKDGL
jgi:hypothetical protein